MDNGIIQQFELLFGGIGIILGLFFSFFIISNFKNQPKANVFLAIYLLAFSIRIGKSLFHNFFEIDFTIRRICLSVLAAVGPSLWLYATHRLKSDHKAYIYFHYFPVVVFLIVSPFLADRTIAFRVFYNGLILYIFIYTIWTLLWVYQREVNQNLENGNEVKKWLIYFLIMNLIIIVSYFLISEVFYTFYIGLSFLFSLAIVIFSIWALKNPFLFRAPLVKYSQSTISVDQSTTILKNLQRLMDNEKPYLDPELTLTKLSKNLNISSKKLSQIINQEEGMNYSQYIAHHRVEEAKNLLKSPSHSHYTIASIAFDSGFNSLSSFNAAFKKFTNITAVAYREGIK